MRCETVCLVLALAAHAQTDQLALESNLPRVSGISALATDSVGNVYATGVANDRTLPVVNAFRPMNTGLQILASGDGGETVTPLSNLPAGRARSLVRDPVVPGRIYAGGNFGLYRSDDGGVTRNRGSRATLFANRPDIHSQALSRSS